jgi:hypothetical protein
VPENLKDKRAKVKIMNWII